MWDCPDVLHLLWAAYRPTETKVPIKLNSATSSYTSLFKNSRIPQGVATKLFRKLSRSLRATNLNSQGFKITSAREGRLGRASPMILIDAADMSTSNTSKPELIIEKITQLERLPRVSRARLLRMLEKSMASGTSTIISGRAGAGKTALSADFAHRCGRPVAWYKVDAPDADPKIFFRYLVRSIQERRPGFGTTRRFCSVLRLLCRPITPRHYTSSRFPVAYCKPVPHFDLTALLRVPI